VTLLYESRRVLIWGKTYPELSKRHKETVCTGGCTEDGKPVRLYPVDFRYLTGDGQYRLYDWIQLPIAKSDKDTRPESFKVRAEQISIGEHLGTGNNWRDRTAVVFRDLSWHYGCLEELKALQKLERRSIGMVAVGSVDEVQVIDRPAEEMTEHAEGLAALKGKGDLFGVEAKDLEFIPFRLRLRWKCAGGSSCTGHSASVLDWGLQELGRREGKEKARQKLESLATLTRHDLHLYMGNLFSRQYIFSCIGLWYPLRTASDPQGVLPLS